MRRGSLLARVVAMLAGVAALPIVISFYQLRSNREALLDQVQRTQAVAAAAAADGIEAYLASLRAALATVADSPLLADARSPSTQALLAALLEARPELASIEVADPAGALVVGVRRSDLKAELAALAPPAGGEVEVLAGASRPWLRLVVPLAAADGRAVLVAAADPVLDALSRPELGDAARTGLFAPGRSLLGAIALDELPPTVAEGLRGGHLGSGGLKVRGAAGDDRVVAFARIPSTRWLVVAEQPAVVAEIAQQRIRAATWIGTVISAGLVAALVAGAWVTVVQPLRRLASAQHGLAGLAGEPPAGDEVAALEHSFRVLEQRVKDGEDLSRVFLGRYQVRRLLGSGGMGNVFEGWDPTLRRPVALKTLRPREGSFDWKGLADQLLAEAATNARFNHPHIVTVFDVARADAAAFIAMEMVEGVDLDALLRSAGPLPTEQVVPLALAIARALAAAHQQGLIHQDVKPGNVLLGRDGSIKVTDFGVSRLLHAASTDADVICGTPGYIAPEVLLGVAPTPASDLFALGVLLYECVSGRHPFRAATVPRTLSQTVWNEPTSLSRVEHLPPALATLIETLLSKEPESRGDAATLVAELEAMAQARDLRWQTAGVEAALEKGPDPERTRRVGSTLLQAIPLSSRPKVARA